MADRSPFRRGRRSPPELLGRDRLTELRRRFLEEGVDPGSEVPSAILRSWRRSRALGLDMDRRPAIESLTHQQMHETRDRNEMLIRAARGEIEALHQDARRSDGIVILTDPRGVILATVGSIDFAERAARVSLRPGVQWNEASIGTNAIGTALAENEAISVLGAEHFFSDHSILGCSAVPILDPAGEIIGVLDLSYDAGVPPTHTLALVRRAVEQIERRLFELRFGQHEQMHFHDDPDLVNSPHEGLLAFEGVQLVGANRRGLDLLGLDWSALGLLRFEEIFDTRSDQIRADGPVEESRIRTLRGSVVFGRILQGFQAIAPVRRPPSIDRRAAAATPPFDHRLKATLDRAVRLADAGIAILLRGEVGSGKEAFARHLHAAGRRRAGPFVRVDCSAQDAVEVERMLFGTPGGSESGAIARARDGTLLLEAVEALPLVLQGRLADALARVDRGAAASGEGGGRDFNLVATTHFSLDERISADLFSPDLALRIAAHTFELEPVRRHPDRRALVLETWRAVAPTGLADMLPKETLDLLVAYGWPGNRRQLIATLRALAVLAATGEALSPETLPHEIREAVGAAPVAAPVALDVEVELESMTLGAMRTALEAEGGNVSRAARRLGIHRSTLYRRLFGSGQSKD